jgi:hypothetical protein
MITTLVLCGLILVAVLVLAMLQPDYHWRDDGNVRRICQHTIRIPSNVERYAMWQMRSALIREFPREL